VVGIGKVGGLGNLSRHSSSGSAEVVDAIPDLGDDEESGSRIAEADVDRQGGIVRVRRQLEAPLPTVGRGQLQHQFLCRKVSCIARLRHEVSAEPDRERPPERDANGRPGGDRRALAVTRLEVADFGLAQTDPMT
jgi:hypothetical protein